MHGSTMILGTVTPLPSFVPALICPNDKLGSLAGIIACWETGSKLVAHTVNTRFGGPRDCWAQEGWLWSCADFWSAGENSVLQATGVVQEDTGSNHPLRTDAYTASDNDVTFNQQRTMSFACVTTGGCSSRSISWLPPWSSQITDSFDMVFEMGIESSTGEIH